jgi:signal transduction histidine kinase
MIPYNGRLAFRVARTVLAFSSLLYYGGTEGWHITWVIAVLTAYAVYALGALPEIRFDSSLRAAIGLVVDAAYFGVWCWVAPSSWVPAFAAGYLLASAAILHDFTRMVSVALAALAMALVLPPPGATSIIWATAAVSVVAGSLAVFKRYLEGRMSSTLRANVIIRSQSQGAREAERQRIAADFHDGPLQSFISFQMRLEIIKKLMGRDTEVALGELIQLQQLCQHQVTELRDFVRSMRPADEGMSLNASIGRMVDLFQRDSGISSTYVAGEFHDPPETEVSLELLQIVREALNNIQKHSGASRVAVSSTRKEERLEVVVEDNGAGLPFSGTFSLEELELLHLGPVSIRRRVRMLGGDLVITSTPTHGAKLEIRVPL